MLNVFLIIQVVVSLLLILVILLQKTSVDGVSTLSGNNMGLMGINSANKFLNKTTIILAIVFAVNLLIIGNYFAKINSNSTKKESSKVEMAQ